MGAHAVSDAVQAAGIRSSAAAACSRPQDVGPARPLGHAAATPPCEPAYAHHVPGRLRVVLQHLKNDRAATEHTCKRLGTIAGVRRVRGNAVLGSLTVEYDPCMAPGAFLGALQAHGIAVRECLKGAAYPACERPLPSGASPWKDAAFAGMALHLVFDFLVWGTAAGALIAR